MKAHEFANAVNVSLGGEIVENATDTDWGFFYQIGETWYAVVKGDLNVIEYTDVDVDEFNPRDNVGFHKVVATTFKDLVEILLKNFSEAAKLVGRL